MADRRPSRLPHDPAASSSGTRVRRLSAGATRSPEPASSSAGAFELHDIPPEALSIATAVWDPHDAAQEDELSSTLDQTNMSRAPLLVRSSPAQGTGSYGGLPVLSMSSSPESDDHHVTSALHRSQRKKGKSRLRHGELAQSRSSLNHSNHDDSIQGEPVHATSRARRRSTKDGGISSEPFGGSEDAGLESSFSSSGALRIFERLHSSSSSNVEEVDEDDSSESGDIPDIKYDAHPSDDSPYAQVRASVAPTDDLSLSINTPRMWTLSIFFAILGSSTNLFFSLRYPSVSITPLIALLLVHPLGLLWDQIFKRSSDPAEVFDNGAYQHDTIYANGGQSDPTLGFQTSQAKATWRRRLRLWLARGRWNQKEHCCVYISSNVSFGFAFATDVSTLHRALVDIRANIAIGHR